MKQKSLEIEQKSGDVIDENKFCHLVGLKNQGATCYLNCVLQSLFHIPAFRFAVYRKAIEKNEMNTNKSIIIQLQILFKLLQTGKDSSISTRALTKSFGWSPDFLQKQQDPHSFLRWLLADALIPELKKSIDDLFGGKIRTTIRGSKEQQIKQVDENFYDLSMIVKDCSSLNESFLKYIESEETNQYTFSPFKENSNATISVSFVKMPKILYLHLKRTEFNFTNRKINSYFSFPLILDIAPYLDSQNEHTGSTKYELFGVIVHHGSTAMAGHYYAYLRTSKNKEWFKFNDSLTLKSNDKEAIYDNFGGKNEEFLNGIIPNKNHSAYMLIYFQKSQIDYIFKESDSLIPENIMKLKTDLNKVKRITFSLFTEESFIINTAKSCLNLTEKGYFEKIAITSTKSINHLYNKVAKLHGIAIGTFRIWILNEYHQFVSILKSDNSNDISTIKYKNLFLDTNNINNDKSATITDKKIIFIFFFFRITIFPIRFLFSTLIGANETLKKIESRLIKVLNTNKTNFNQMKCFEYSSYISSGKIGFKKVDFSIGYAEIINGSCFILQYNTKKDLSQAPLYQPIHHFTSNDIFLIEKVHYQTFSNVIEYFQNVSENCSFEFTDNFHFSAKWNLFCPCKFQIRFFLELISQVISINKYQLFAKHIQKPIEVSKFENIGQLYEYIVQNNGNHAPLLFVSDILDPDVIPLNVILSNDAIQPSSFQRVFIRKTEKVVYNDLLNSLSNKFDNDPSKSEIRVVVIKNKMIESIHNVDQNCEFEADWIRFEIIPIEQRVKFAKNVEKLCQCRFIGGVNKIEELPFLFVIFNTDTLFLLKEKMKRLDFIDDDSELYLIKNKKKIDVKDDELIFSYIDISSIILIRI